MTNSLVSNIILFPELTIDCNFEKLDQDNLVLSHVPDVLI